MVTIGISIGLPEPHASQVQQVRRSVGDPQAEGIRTHVTLLPPTQVPAADLPAIRHHLRDVAAARGPFGIRLEGTGTFRPVSPVVFLKLVGGDRECTDLAQQIRCGPLDRTLEFPYHPHVTVAHEVSDEALDRADAQMARFAVDFPVEEFQLYVQDASAAWHPVDGYPLTAADGS